MSPDLTRRNTATISAAEDIVRACTTASVGWNVNPESLLCLEGSPLPQARPGRAVRAMPPPSQAQAAAIRSRLKAAAGVVETGGSCDESSPSHSGDHPLTKESEARARLHGMKMQTLHVLLAKDQALFPSSDPESRTVSTPTEVLGTSKHSKVGVACKGSSAGEVKAKMDLLGMLGEAHSAKESSGQRVAAATAWIDGAAGESMGNCWRGRIRRGAAPDLVSRAVRRLHATSIAAAAARITAGNSLRQAGGRFFPPAGLEGDPLAAAFSGRCPQFADASLGPTRGWWPNPEPSEGGDEAEAFNGSGLRGRDGEAGWGGRWGKPCAHNEVVMHVLRPFAPLEVRQNV